jgi:hypothetical protein
MSKDANARAVVTDRQTCAARRQCSVGALSPAFIFCHPERRLRSEGSPRSDGSFSLASGVGNRFA